jgi:CheY-like chemotaxis protein
MKILENLKILIVDDEPDLRELFADELKSFGAKTFEATQGTEALEFLKKNEIDVVISDIRMPGGYGITLVKNINSSIQPKPLVFFCTGFTEYPEEDLKNLDIVKIFNKPFNWDDVVQSISQAVNEKI